MSQEADSQIITFKIKMADGREEVVLLRHPGHQIRLCDAIELARKDNPGKALRPFTKEHMTAFMDTPLPPESRKLFPYPVEIQALYGLDDPGQVHGLSLRIYNDGKPHPVRSLGWKSDSLFYKNDWMAVILAG